MIRLSLNLLLFAAVLASSGAQENVPPTLRVTFPKEAKVGAKVSGTVQLTFASGLHGYQNPPTESFQIPVKVGIDTKGYKLARVFYPVGSPFKMEGDAKPSSVYEGTLKIPIWVTMPAKPGAGQFKVTVTYQQCNDKSCFPPGTLSAMVKLKLKK